MSHRSNQRCMPQNQSEIYTKFFVAVVLAFGLGGGLNVEAKPSPCAKDRETHCAGIERGDGRIARCMKENKEKLSAECKAHLEERKKDLKESMEACESDIETHCDDIERGKGRLIRCLIEKKESLSEGCKKAIEEARPHKMKRELKK